MPQDVFLALKSGRTQKIANVVSWTAADVDEYPGKTWRNTGLAVCDALSSGTIINGSSTLDADDVAAGTAPRYLLRKRTYWVFTDSNSFVWKVAMEEIEAMGTQAPTRN
jgi:hypothetical protein